MPRIRKLFNSTSALGVYLQMEEILATALGRRLAAHRESGITSAAAFARIEELEHRVRLLERWVEVYAALVQKVARLHRFQWSKEARLEILRLKKAERLTTVEAARRASVSPSTIHRWEAEAFAHPDRTTIGTLLKSIPPVRRIADAVREKAREIDAMGLLGARSIAQHLSRAALRISATTVRRIRKEAAPRDAAADGMRKPHVDRPIRARIPRHIYMLDLTSVGGWLRVFDLKKIALVLDSYSRFPVAARVFRKEPSAVEIRDLLQRGFVKFGAPRIFITDHGSAFTSHDVAELMRHWKIDHRLGAVGHSGSIALIERAWKTLKILLGVTATLKRLLAAPFRPLVAEDLTCRLETALAYYADYRPHQGLGGATPAEMFFGLRPKHLDAIPAPRGRPGELCDPIPVQIRFLDRDQRLPYLVRTDGLADAA